MSSIQLQVIQEEHLSSVLTLIKELAVFEKEPDAVIIDEAVLRKAVLEDQLSYGWVAIEKDVVVGLAICYVRFSTWKGPCAYLEDLIVNADHRGKGIGKLLLDQVIDDARDKGYHHAMWQVLDWNTPAVDFYEQYGATVEKEWWNVKLVL